MKRFVLPAIAVLSLAFLVACGGGNSTHLPAPPPPVLPHSGGFSNSDFSGTYTFSVSGEDFDAAGNPSRFAMAGTFTACGCAAGTISAGTVTLGDIHSLAGGGAIQSGSGYSINSDGRGTASLSIATVNYPVTLDFVLTSSSHGLIIRFDAAGTGSGSIDLQPAAVTQSALDYTPYAFSLSGFDVLGYPVLTSGAFKLSSGYYIGGIEDFTTYKVPAMSYQGFALGGSLVVGSGTAPGGATFNINDSSGTRIDTLDFDVYAVDATHLKLIGSGQGDFPIGVSFLVGDVFSQSSATIPSGNLVFTMAGLDAAGAPFGAGGTVLSDGSKKLTSGAEDLNDAGTVDGGTTTPVAFTGSFAATPSGSGRFVVTLTGFSGGATFAAYPSSGGILMQEIDQTASAGITGGLMMAQTSGASLAASQGYGMNLTGTDLTTATEFDAIAQFNTPNSGMAGLIDLNDFGPSGLTATSNFAGNYTPGNNGTGSATFTSGPLGGVLYYAADNSTALLISTDSTDVAIGTLEVQSTPSAAHADVAQRNLAMIKSVHAAKRPESNGSKIKNERTRNFAPLGGP